MARCWLAQIPGAGPCHGSLIRAHLIPQQRIKREFPRGAWIAELADVWVRSPPLDALDDEAWPYRPLRELLDDARVWVWACGGWTGLGGHHGALDVARTLRIPRAMLPAELVEYAVELGQIAWLEREYGAR